MARQRDYRAEYERRQAKARQEGFTSYAAKRKASERAKGKPSRDHAAEYARQKAKAQAEGYSSPSVRQRARRLAHEAAERMRRLVGNRRKFRMAGVHKNIARVIAEDDDAIERLEEFMNMTDEEVMDRIGDITIDDDILKYH